MRCEQLILGWSQDNLLRTDGFGPIAASTGWPLDAGDRTAGLGEWSAFLPEGSSSRIAEGEPAPFCAAFVPVRAGIGLPGGVVLLSKVYLTRADRPGQYYIHALWDPEGRLAPADLAGAYRAGLLLSDDAAPPTGELPPLDVPVETVTEPGAVVDEDVTLVGHLVHAWLNDYRLVVDIGQREPIVTLDQLSRLLPQSVAREMAMTTFLGRQDPAPATLAFAVFPFSPAAVGWDELVADHRHDDLGHGVLAGGPHVDEPSRLRAWAQLRDTDLSSFRRGPGSAQERAAAQAEVSDRLDDQAILHSLLPALRAGAGRPVIAVPRIAELAAGSTVDLSEFDWAVGTENWSRLSNHLVGVWLSGARRPAAHIVRQAHVAPDRFGAAVEAGLAREDAPEVEELVEVLQRWPDEHVELLLTALAPVALPAGVLLAAVLDRPEPVLRRVLRSHWPQLAEQADLAPLGKLLRPSGGRLFDRR
ncbi:hypothetical protein [Enemella sp. A6]|uniref:hypothetical protein n=1 Tax=Enemella sp. A6 TaxID=3440152 RepID=UPI003EBC4C7C